MDELTRRRLEANRELWARLGELIEDYPEQRFGQILRNFGFVQQEMNDVDVWWTDEFNLEPMELLRRVDRQTRRLRKG